MWSMIRKFRRLFWIAGFWAFLCLVVAAASVGYGSGPGDGLPARDWNGVNLARLEALKLKDPFTVAVFGDSRTNPLVFESLLTQVRRDKEIAFAIHLGDMVDYADLGQYRRFFSQVRENLHIPLLVAVGNHDLQKDKAGLYDRLFGPRYYSFRVAGHCFLILDATDKNGPGEDQLRWLEAELQKAQACLTRLVFMHVPLCDPRGGEHRHCLTGEAAARLLGLLKRYKVSHVFAAHIHAYFTGEMDGVPYTITGGAGAPLYGEVPQAAFYNFLQVTLRGNNVRIQVHPVADPGTGSHLPEWKGWAAIPGAPQANQGGDACLRMNGPFWP